LRPGERATVVFDTGTDAWTLGFDAEGASLSTRRARAPDAVLHAPADVMAGVIEGTRSGVDAWLAGQLTMRGNIALALRLPGTIHPDRPVPIPRARPPPPPPPHPARRPAAAHALAPFSLEGGRGPAVVLLHGLGATNSSMLPTLAELSHDHHVFAPDLPGFGESGKPLRA